MPGKRSFRFGIYLQHNNNKYIKKYKNLEKALNSISCPDSFSCFIMKLLQLAATLTAYHIQVNIIINICCTAVFNISFTHQINLLSNTQCYALSKVTSQCFRSKNDLRLNCPGTTEHMLSRHLWLIRLDLSANYQLVPENMDD